MKLCRGKKHFMLSQSCKDCKGCTNKSFISRILLLNVYIFQSKTIPYDITYFRVIIVICIYNMDEFVPSISESIES